MKKNTVYYIIAAAAAYYAYLYFKNKNKAMAPVAELPSQSSFNIVDEPVLNIVEALRPLIPKNTDVKPLIETAETYQTFYGQMAGMNYKKVPQTC